MKLLPARTVSVRALDKALEHRDALMGHLQERWSDLFGAQWQILLYDLTSTYFEGEAAGVECAARGYSRDHRPDTLQILVALVVHPGRLSGGLRGFRWGHCGRNHPRRDSGHDREQVWDKEAGGGCLIVALSARIISKIFGNAEPIIWWALRAASSPTLNASCLRATGKKFAGKPGGSVQLLEEAGETFVLGRSLQRAKKESAMLRSQLLRLHRSLRALRRVAASGGLKDTSKIERRLGRLEERSPQGWSILSAIEHQGGRRLWSRNKARLRGAKLRQGAYLLRTNLDPRDPDALWHRQIRAAYRSGNRLPCS